MTTTLTTTGPAPGRGVGTGIGRGGGVVTEAGRGDETQTRQIGVVVEITIVGKKDHPEWKKKGTKMKKKKEG
jgi:hypothetical protein